MPGQNLTPPYSKAHALSHAIRCQWPEVQCVELYTDYLLVKRGDATVCSIKLAQKYHALSTQIYELRLPKNADNDSIWDTLPDALYTYPELMSQLEPLIRLAAI